jgi:carboxyl-terminal processing protease
VGLITTPALIASTSSGLAVAVLRDKAKKCEERGAWLEACRLYDQLLRADRGDESTRKAYQKCLRRLHLAARHRDASYRRTIYKLTLPQAIDLYDQVLEVVSVNYVDRGKTGMSGLFQNGLQELLFALDDETFRRHFMPGAKPASLESLKSKLASWPVKKAMNRAEAREQVLTVVRAFRDKGLSGRPGLFAAVGLEFAAGACNSLDEHTAFLSPKHAGGSSESSARTRRVGIGATLGLRDGKLIVGRVLAKSPALGKLLQGDRVTSIGDRDVEDLSADAAAELLNGMPGTEVEIGIQRETEKGLEKQTVKMRRRPVAVPSVEFEAVNHKEAPLGYLRINHFNEDTLQEVREALAVLQTTSGESIKGLILDLRGNPGGLFKSAVHVAELFLAHGVIAHATSPHKEYNRSFKVEAANPFMLPMVVLVDGETASAAEVLAGALKERQERQESPTRLLGQTTYGKGSIQCVFPVEKTPFDKAPATIRLTVARFSSPSNLPYSGRGVIPDHVAEAGNVMDQAKELLVKLLQPMMPPPMPMQMAMGEPKMS